MPETAASLSQWLPLAALALLPAALVDALLARSDIGRGPRLAAVAAIVALMLAPFGPVPAAGWLRGALGDASIGSLAVLGLYFAQAFGPPAWRAWLRRSRPQLTVLAAALVIVAAAFYPLSLGAGWADPYAAGYYPSVLSAVLLTLFCIAAFAGWWIPAALVALAYAGFAGYWLESSNLWDYLFDVPLSLAALVWVMTHHRDLGVVSKSGFTARRVTIGAFITIAVFLVFSVVLFGSLAYAFFVAGVLVAVGWLGYTAGDLLADRNVAGTGTINPAGEIGAIGGARQKLVSAQKDGATVFLVPSANCADLAGVRTDLTVVKVSTLSQAISELRVLDIPGGEQRVSRCDN